MSTQRSAVVVSRKWAESRINREVSIHAHRDDEKITLSMSLDQFVSCLAAEVGNPMLLMTTKALEKALQKASAQVVEEIKLGSIAIV